MHYQNPVLRGFHPDPSVCRVGDDFYLVVSSFEYFPGIPIYHSRDLVNWTQIGNCLQRAEEFPLMNVGDSGGVWAPTIRWHNGLFYVTATLEGYGNFIVTAEDPAGAWSSPVWLKEVGGIDPSLFFEDGHAWYCTNDRLDPDQEAITLEEVDVQTGRIIGQRYTLWSGMGAHFLEAPHIYHIGGWYYLLTAEGGTFYTHMITVARSRCLTGPYEACPTNPILTNACDPTWQVQCAGHGDLVEDAQGHWWMIHLGIRLARRTMTHLGRETFLTPVIWQDEWPLCPGSKAVLDADAPLPAPRQPIQPFTADFSCIDWEPEWIFLRQNAGLYHRRIPNAMLLYPQQQTMCDPAPTFAAVRPLDFDCTVDTTFTFASCRPGDEAGLAVRLSSQFYITCTVGPGRVLTLTQHMEDIHHVIATAVLPEGEVQLRLTADREKYVFSYWSNGTYHVLGHASTRFLAVEIAGKCFTGTVMGLYTSCVQETNAVMRVASFSMHI